jgi:hypothetical protein
LIFGFSDPMPPMPPMPLVIAHDEGFDFYMPRRAQT